MATQPTNGAITGIANTTCSNTTPNDCSADVTYTPNLNYNGTDGFTFTVNDGRQDSLPANVNLTITPVNDPPVADPESGKHPRRHARYHHADRLRRRQHSLDVHAAATPLTAA